MCRVVGIAYVEWTVSYDAVPHDEGGVKNRIRQDEDDRREMRQREGALERLERQRRERETEEMAPRIAEEDPRGGRVVDEKPGAAANQSEGEHEMHGGSVHQGEGRKSSRGHRDEDAENPVHVVQEVDRVEQRGHRHDRQDSEDRIVAQLLHLGSPVHEACPRQELPQELSPRTEINPRASAMSAPTTSPVEGATSADAPMAAAMRGAITSARAMAMPPRSGVDSACALCEAG